VPWQLVVGSGVACFHPCDLLAWAVLVSRLQPSLLPSQDAARQCSGFLHGRGRVCGGPQRRPRACMLCTSGASSTSVVPLGPIVSLGRAAAVLPVTQAWHQGSNL
jgi:hypothetical protein